MDELEKDQLKAVPAEKQENDGSSHHHHHRHHSRAYYKYRLIKHKLKKPFKTKRGRAIVFSVLAFAAAVIAALSIYAQKTVPETQTEIPSQAIAETGFVGMNVSSFGKPQLVVNAVIENYFTSNSAIPISDVLASNPKGKRLDIGVPVELSYRMLNLPSGVTVEDAKLEVAENEELKSPEIYKAATESGGAELYFLKTGTKYFYRITVTLSDATVLSSRSSFETAETPRVLSVDGIANVRDIGAWQTEDGKRIRQGMLIRGSELDGAVDARYKLTERGFSQMLTDLGIKYDFDLRGKEENLPDGSALGDTVGHQYYGALYYSNIFTDKGKKAAKNIFRDFAKKEHYPMYMHCTLGKDRTGTICFILEALLGLSDEDLLKEYELSYLCFIDETPRERDGDFMNFVNDFYSLPGSNAKEKAENYLLSVGVTKDELESIRNILLEE